ncbi:MAG: carboxypeptidase-like regulatory domain-containing protein, partial [Actinomycetota bacterium]|nr:carboxypeptidase-like regulatory domain-containing protein [Actinomycetota bacterium]
MKRFALIIMPMLLVFGCLWSATVSGFVTRGGSGEPLQYVNVRIAGTKIGGQTNKKGYYVLNITQPGNYVLDFSLISYIDTSIPFTVGTLGEEVKVDAVLDRGSIELNKTVVTADADPSLEGTQIRNSLVRQNTEDIKMVVSPVEADIF